MSSSSSANPKTWKQKQQEEKFSARANVISISSTGSRLSYGGFPALTQEGLLIANQVDQLHVELLIRKMETSKVFFSFFGFFVSQVYTDENRRCSHDQIEIQVKYTHQSAHSTWVGSQLMCLPSCNVCMAAMSVSSSWNPNTCACRGSLRKRTTRYLVQCCF